MRYAGFSFACSHTFHENPTVRRKHLSLAFVGQPDEHASAAAVRGSNHMPIIQPLRFVIGGLDCWRNRRDPARCSDMADGFEQRLSVGAAELSLQAVPPLSFAIVHKGDKALWCVRRETASKRCAPPANHDAGLAHPKVT